MARNDNELLATKELAAALGRSRRYVQAMKRAGFVMTGGRASVREAREWLVRHPPPCSRKAA